MESVFIQVGEFHIASVPTLISTVLGSCVAVCLFDRRTKIAAMNHYLLPFGMNSVAPLKCGDASCEAMISQMLARGATANAIDAKICGGANISRSGIESMKIGEKNVQMAIDVLGKYQIKISHMDTGGNIGRKVTFNTQTNTVDVSYTNAP